MTAVLDAGLISFATELLEQHGAVVESHPDHILSLLPSDLSRSIGLPEEAKLGVADAPLLYGSPLLDRLIRMATHHVPLAYGSIHVPYLKKEGFEQVISNDIQLVGMQAELTGRAETIGSYVVLACHYVALSDERKEGLVHVAVNESTGAVIEGFEDEWRHFQCTYFNETQLPPQFNSSPENAVSQAIKSARAASEVRLSTFVSGMRRRLHRDVKNTREYYEALAKEMEGGLSHPNLTEQQKSDRMSKMTELPREMNAKIEDLKQKYRVTVDVTGRAALRFLVPVVSIMVRIRHGNRRRSWSLVWNPVTRRLDPPTCERCGTTFSKIYPTADKSGIQLLCRICSETKNELAGTPE